MVEKVAEQAAGAAKADKKGLPVYEYKQPGTAVLITLGLAILMAFYMHNEYSYMLNITPFMVVMVGALCIVGTVFSSITITVDDIAIRLKYGMGLSGQIIPFYDIVSIAQVAPRSADGFKIRYLGNTWVYNIRGTDGVELELKDGRKVRIGTKDPHGLTEAVNKRLK